MRLLRAGVGLTGGVLLAGVLALAVGDRSAAGAVDPAAVDVPPVVLRAYTLAAAGADQRWPTCRLRWSALAGIGKVETDHGRTGGAAADDRGDVRPPIIGIPLDGRGGTARIPDTDGGALDRDVVWDRAVGPMQFIPTSWARHGADGDGDGRADPHNAFDAALAAASHLCAAGADLSSPAGLAAAVRGYNRSDAYVAAVLGWIASYESAAVGTTTGGAGAHVLPLDRRWVTLAAVRAPHHDYPAWDRGVPVGTPVHAVIGGTVTATTARSSRCGLGVVVAGDDGHRWTYCHAVQVLVTAGERVRTGQPIMRSGNTGNSTGPHLHLALHVAGVARCPQPLLEAWLEGRPADPADAPATGCTF